MAPKSRCLKSFNHNVVMWNTNRSRRLYFKIFFNSPFLCFPILSLNCVCCHMFSAENFSVFMYPQLYLFPYTELILNHIYSTQFPSIFTLIKRTMRFKQIRKGIYMFWCQNGPILTTTILT
jgi:hypothetical protein